MTDTHKLSADQYRALLLEHGLPVELPAGAEQVLLVMRRRGSAAVVSALEHGLFSHRGETLLVLPPDGDLVAEVRALAAATTGGAALATAVDTAVSGGGSCSRSPCDDDPKITLARLEEARREVGKRKAKVGRTSGLLYIAYGLGVDSTAILVGLSQLVRDGREEFKPDYIVFADTGAEKQATYDYMSVLSKWLKKVGFPQVQVAAYATEFQSKSFGSSRTLEQQVLLTQHLPSISATKFKYATCSQLWKQAAQQKWLEMASGLYERSGRSWLPRKGLKITKAIGYDADETDRAKRGTFRVEDDKRLYAAKGAENPFSYWYPLQDWDWDRARCIAEIEAEINVVPPKSSCTFCGAMKPFEIETLPKDELLRALLVEQVALNGWHADDYREKGNKGLGVKFAWTDLALERGLITGREHAALMRQVEKITSLPEVRGGENYADHPVYRALPAFKDVRGFRGKRLPIWDRFDTISAERRAES